MTMVIVYFYILQQNLWINISFDEDTVENIIHGTIWDLDTQLVFYDISKSSQIGRWMSSDLVLYCELLLVMVIGSMWRYLNFGEFFLDLVHNWNFLWWYPNSPFPSPPAMGEVLLSLCHLPCPEGCLFSPLPPYDSCVGEGIGVICMINSAIHWWVITGFLHSRGFNLWYPCCGSTPCYIVAEWECECCANEGPMLMFFWPIVTLFEWLILFLCFLPLIVSWCHVLD